jgi:microcystin-dependent protein
VIWGREYDVALLGGGFNVVLGAAGAGAVAEPTAVNDLAFAFGDANRFLELRVVRDAAAATVNRTILPRQQLLSSPYALQAGRLIKEYQDALCPPGTIIAFGGTNIPSGWLLCDGKAVASGNYPRLFAAVGRNWGSGIAGTAQDFNLPDFRGYFLRGVSGGTDRDPDRDGRTAISAGGNVGNQVGSVQNHKLQVHSHKWGATTSGSSTERVLRSWTSAAQSAPLTTILEDWDAGLVDNASGTDNSFRVAPTTAVSLYTDSTSTIGQSGETRPANAYVHYIIKY